MYLHISLFSCNMSIQFQMKNKEEIKCYSLSFIIQTPLPYVYLIHKTFLCVIYKPLLKHYCDLNILPTANWRIKEMEWLDKQTANFARV